MTRSDATKKKIRHAAILCLIGLATLAWLTHYAPLYLPSYLCWLGFLLAAAGLVSLLLPLRFLLIANRRQAAGILFIGLGLALACLNWPSSPMRSRLPRQRIDDFMPVYSFVEHHSTLVHADPDQVMRAVRQTNIADIPAVRFLMRIRRAVGGAQAEESALNQPPTSFFLTLVGDDPREYVGALAGQPWGAAVMQKLVGPDDFMAFHTPGHIKVVFHFLVQEQGRGVTLLSTETRIQGNDAQANRTFARYWRVIYPGSAIIRRLWLDAISALAERNAAAEKRMPPAHPPRIGS